jgi:hypothetical protein
MNLWARILGQLAVLTVALFFFSCEDETSILGFKNPNKKFKVNYVDIPLPSDVFLMDSLRTSNHYDADNRYPNETMRMLVGKYADDALGDVRAAALTQFFTTTPSPLDEFAVFDSVTLQLRFDYYVYGNQSATPQTISVHELQQDLKRDSTDYYFNRSTTAYDANALGSKTFTIIPEDFKKYVDDQKDTTISITIPLDPSFGQRIFDSAVKYRDATTVEDSAFVKYSEFVKEFKGIAIVPEGGDKIVGFTPGSGSSAIRLHYHDADTDSLVLNLAFQPTTTYNAITDDRSSTELASLGQYSQPFLPASSERYIQSGAGVLTRLDFQPFYNFVDADTNSNVVINSAEVLLGPAAESTSLDPINTIMLVAVKHNAYLRRVADRLADPTQYAADSTSVANYGGKMGISGGFFSPLDADGNILLISKSGENDYYNGFMTLFAQEFFKHHDGMDRFPYFALYPLSPQIGKSVNRLIFDADNIKLRIYYTRPTEPAQ